MNPIVSVLQESVTPGLLVAGLLLALLPLIDRDSRWRAIPVAVVLVLVARYLYWRVTATIPPMSDPVDFAAGVAFFAVECVAVVGSVISYVTLSRTKDRSPEADANTAWLAARPAPPLVDVFICTYNEELEILERTMMGALGMSYPNHRVWVLDDGRRQWLADLAASLGCNYLTRADNAHAKAGNINNAIRHVSALDTPPDFISILDADFVPTPAFLSRTLPLFREDDVGIVQTPQHFINPDPIQANLQASDAWPDEQRYFFDVLMVSKDAWGTAFCCGTSSVIRMEALAGIGGFPTDSVTEDYLLTLRLKRNGYRTVYLNERLSLGLAPEGLQEYITQRGRWCLGFMQIVRGPDGPLRPGNGLRLADRFSLAESFLYWSGAYLFRIAGILVPILYLLFGIHAVNVDVVDGISNFLPYYVGQVMVMGWLSGKRVLPIMTDVSQLLAARDILTAVTLGLFRPKGQKFKVTAKGGDRSRGIIQWRMLVVFVALFLLTVAGVSVAFDGRASLQDSSLVALYWSWYNLVVLGAAIAVCFEKPRLRRSERLRGHIPVTINAGSVPRRYVTADLSLGGMRIRGTINALPGTSVEVRLGDDTLHGRIVRRSEREFAVAVDESLAARAAMMRHVYSGSLAPTVERIRSTFLARKLFTRLFR